MREFRDCIFRSLAFAQFIGGGAASNFRRHQSIAAIRIAMVLTGLMMVFGSAGQASTIPLSYMTIPSVPTSGAIYALPGYGNVKITWAPTSSNGPMPAFSYQDIVPVHNQSAGTNPVYTWGTDSQDINMYDTTGAPVSYNMAFTFLNGAPDLNRLILAVSGLSAGTVTLGTTATVSQSGALVGEVQIPLGLPSSPTLINGNTSGSGTVLSSGYTSSSGTNLQNTGWALFKVAPPSPLTLSVKFNQLNGDGIGVTLAYANTGVLKICKVAGQGIDLTDPPFHFTANGSGLDVPPGPGPGGYCEVGPSFAPGTNVTVTETIPAGVSVSNISVTPPAQLVNTNLATGTATVTMGAGVTEVTYTDERKSGYLEICKSGPTSGNFAFSVNPGGLGPFTVPAGACSPAIAVAAGSVTITETTAGAIMVGCSTIPSNRQGACNTTARTSTVTVVPGGVSTQTIATIQNH